MQQVLNPTEISNATTEGMYRHTAKTQTSALTKFFIWCEGQEYHKILWMGLTYIGQIGFALPCTLFAILVFGGNNFNLWILAIVLNVPVLAITLAAQPTKVSLPALFAAWIADALIILGCFVSFVTQ